MFTQVKHQPSEWDLIELERYRENERQRDEERERKQEQRERERKEVWEYEMRTASTWPEALGKQASLFANESSQWFAGENGEYPDDYFGPGAEACNRALEIWKEVKASKQSKIEELERQMAAIQNEIRLEVAKQLFSENDQPGWKGVARSIEDDVDLNSWLYW